MSRLAVSLLIIALFLYVASPLFMPLAMGAVFSVLFYPLFERLQRWRVSRGLSAGLVTLAVTLVVVIPMATLIFLAARAGLDQFRVWRESPNPPGQSLAEGMMHSSLIRGVLERLAAWLPFQMSDITNTVEDLVGVVGTKVGDVLAGLVTQIPSLSMGLAIMVISIYFFLCDGGRIVGFIRRNSMFSPLETDRMIHSVASMCRSVILATVASGLVQALIFGVACFAVGHDSAALIGFTVFLASFIPLVGSAPLTFGVALHQLLLGNRTEAIVLVVAAVVAGVSDNLIRPFVLKGAGNLHPLLAFIAAFGGLQILGFSGIFLGPILAGLFVVTIDHLTAS